ncbi:MAG: hypothetical protein LBN05_09030 [Oscillospiraceae bacterium]|jgi:hypothetical protein|nr:hypothetical protein [Oscillospiraceae bacterium]
MYEISAALQEYLLEPDARMTLRWGDKLAPEDFQSGGFTYTKAIGSESLWVPGAAPIGVIECEATLQNVTQYLQQKDTFYASYVLPDGSTEEIPLGVFKLCEAVAQTTPGTYKLYFQDNITELGVTTSLTYSAGMTTADIGDMLALCVAELGLQLSTPAPYLLNWTAKNQVTIEGTLRQLLSWFAAAICGWVDVDRQGVICIRQVSGQQHSLGLVRDAGTFEAPADPPRDAGTFTTPNEEYHDAGYFINNTDAANVLQVTPDIAVEINLSTNAQYYGGLLFADEALASDGLNYSFENNPFMEIYSHSNFDTVEAEQWLQVAALAAYIPASVKIRWYPHVDIGDKISIRSSQYTLETVCTSITASGGLGTYTALGSDNAKTFVSPEQNNINRLNKAMSDAIALSLRHDRDDDFRLVVDEDAPAFDQNGIYSGAHPPLFVFFNMSNLSSSYTDRQRRTYCERALNAYCRSLQAAPHTAWYYTPAINITETGAPTNSSYYSVMINADSDFPPQDMAAINASLFASLTLQAAEEEPSLPELTASAKALVDDKWFTISSAWGGTGYPATWTELGYMLPSTVRGYGAILPLKGQSLPQYLLTSVGALEGFPMMPVLHAYNDMSPPGAPVDAYGNYYTYKSLGAATGALFTYRPSVLSAGYSYDANQNPFNVKVGPDSFILQVKGTRVFLVGENGVKCELPFDYPGKLTQKDLQQLMAYIGMGTISYDGGELVFTLDENVLSDMVSKGYAYPRISAAETAIAQLQSRQSWPDLQTMYRNMIGNSSATLSTQSQLWTAFLEFMEKLVPLKYDRTLTSDATISPSALFAVTGIAGVSTMQVINAYIISTSTSPQMVFVGRSSSTLYLRNMSTSSYTIPAGSTLRVVYTTT